MKSVKDVKRKEYYIFSPFLRIFHWIMVGSIVTLFATGLLITKPALVSATEPNFTMLSMDLIRDIHFLVAFLFCASFILRIYGFIINKGGAKSQDVIDLMHLVQKEVFDRFGVQLVPEVSGLLIYQNGRKLPHPQPERGCEHGSEHFFQFLFLL